MPPAARLHFREGGLARGPPFAFLLLLGLELLYPILELRGHVGIAQRGHIAQLASLRDVAEQAAHDLARPCLRQVVGPDDALGPRNLPDALGHRLADLALQLLAALEVALERDERANGLPGVLVLLADHRALGDLGV